MDAKEYLESKVVNDDPKMGYQDWLHYCDCRHEEQMAIEIPLWMEQYLRLQNTDKKESLARIDEYVETQETNTDSIPEPKPVIVEPKEIGEGAAESGMDDRMGIVSGFEFPDSTVILIDDDLIGAAASAYEKIACCEKDHPWLKEYVNEDFVAGAQWMQSEIIESNNSNSHGKRKYSDDEIEDLSVKYAKEHSCRTKDEYDMGLDFIAGFKAAIRELELTTKTD